MRKETDTKVEKVNAKEAVQSLQGREESGIEGGGER